jgi:hypothetical protein
LVADVPELRKMWWVGQDVDLTSRDLNNSTGMNGMSSTASIVEG